MNHNPLKLERTQDLPIMYEENSAFYMFESGSFLRTSSRVGVDPYFYEVSFPENIDIDTESDFSMACDIYRLGDSCNEK